MKKRVTFSIQEQKLGDDSISKSCSKKRIYDVPTVP